jgi:hypothetical protein
MASVVDTVNMSSEQRTSYRHGDLSAALVRAGIELAQSGGPQAVVLREATRRVGVSPNAAYRHFADHRALLRAVAAVAMSQLAETMEGRQSAVSTRIRPPRRARERLRAVGAGYLDYARAEPGLFRTAFTVADELDDALAVGPSGARPSSCCPTPWTAWSRWGCCRRDGVRTPSCWRGRRCTAWPCSSSRALSSSSTRRTPGRSATSCWTTSRRGCSRSPA